MIPPAAGDQRDSITAALMNIARPPPQLPQMQLPQMPQGQGMPPQIPQLPPQGMPPQMPLR
jgi:hypothetical protein